MMNNERNRVRERFFLVLLILVLAVSMAAGNVYAYSSEEVPSASADQKETEADDPSGDTGTASGSFYSKGNLTLKDDLSDKKHTNNETSDRQFLTLESKDGNTFYMVIDRTGDKENVYFMNLVDEEDLMALTENQEQEELLCTCMDHCEVGKIDTSCKQCSVDMTQCEGIAPAAAPEEPEEAASENSRERGRTLASVGLLAILGAAAGAAGFFAARRKKEKTHGYDDLDDYDYGQEDDLTDLTEEMIWAETPENGKGDA